MEAPGGPGAPPMWGTGRKMAFGAAPGSRSKVWYTLADGTLSEVFFPFLDHVALHELRFFVSAGRGPPGAAPPGGAGHGDRDSPPAAAVPRRPPPHHTPRAQTVFFVPAGAASAHPGRGCP